jgi:hypothetical protein
MIECPGVGFGLFMYYAMPWLLMAGLVGFLVGTLIGWRCRSVR